jgi:hypothetical protein
MSALSLFGEPVIPAALGLGAGQDSLEAAESPRPAMAISSRSARSTSSTVAMNSSMSR